MLTIGNWQLEPWRGLASLGGPPTPSTTLSLTPVLRAAPGLLRVATIDRTDSRYDPTGFLIVRDCI